MHKGDEDLLPHSMINRTAVWSSGVYQACLMSAVYDAIYFLPIYFQSIHNTSPMMSDLYILPIILPQVAKAASSGAISKSADNENSFPVLSLRSFKTARFIHMYQVQPLKRSYTINFKVISIIFLNIKDVNVIILVIMTSLYIIIISG
ncbi:hypothetical protein BGW36DRAFT_21543 [Talaromyces proteolyticus]|uniref:Uncharacterized protein n=1 Tax=Talaromyces proteolyticus TaxID=1131652 RepID=A0AAD4L523_9EURO|nr:uncharacterized protein BGW36DRAFT_21543 [Talaromyces proteolyticus]KAH8706028.1 hypothetical protein BGW36DRAFT_21543 [Talaromyces proteolyticus]